LLRCDGGKIKNPDLVPASECACWCEECSLYFAPSTGSLPLSPGYLLAVKDIVVDVNSARAAGLLDEGRRELRLSPPILPFGRSIADLSIGAAVLVRVLAVAPLGRDGNEFAAINIGEGSTAQPVVTNVLY
jgi:hypothetical protein